MNAKTNFSPARLVAWCMMLLGMGSLPAAAEESDKTHIAVLTRYEVKEAYQEAFRDALKNYVALALLNGHNMMAEAYAEQDQPSVLWVVERWNNQAGFEGNAELPPSKAIDLLAENALSKPAERTYLRDLEPVSRKQWRTAANPADRPLTIMLFVDAKSGTEQRFRDVYHQAMPKFRSEPGVINYQLSQFADDSTRFVTYERFRNEAAFQYHLNFPPIQPVIDYLNTSIRKQPFQTGLHRLVAIPAAQ
ncbi:Quinol monooxygenase YgiN [Dyadobacter sp. SG02]|uniref:putative quinol monooxygenase n=1 Tax=Dyadobacter sp. SG02 TaxID=1855291 RepID=UPI0008C69C76|nr:antibiotic biosynthesis monooxygenase [Dyadobacter sp. SG02]SEI53027.1 Quinol monooxygenase YgiN [Dyadobacter sp. SG02]